MRAATRVQLAVPAGVWGDQSKEKGACDANTVFIMLIKSLCFVWRRQKAPSYRLGGGGASSECLKCLPPADDKSCDENDHEHHTA